MRSSSPDPTSIVLPSLHPITPGINQSWCRAKPQSLFAKTTAGRGLQTQQEQQQQQQEMGGKVVEKDEGEGLFEKSSGEKEP